MDLRKIVAILCLIERRALCRTTPSPVSSCVECPPDKYANKVSCPKECIPCPDQSSTLGVKNVKHIIGCHCPPGFFMDLINKICSRCPYPPNKFYCPGFTDCQKDPILQETGYYSKRIASVPMDPIYMSSSVVFYKCQNRMFCPMHQEGTGCSALSVKCAEGHDHFLCSKCVPGFHRVPFLSTCTACPKFPVAFLILAFLLWLIVYFLIIGTLVPVTEKILSLKSLKKMTKYNAIPLFRMFALFYTSLVSFGGFAMDIDYNITETYEYLGPFNYIIRGLFFLSLNTGFFFQGSFSDCIYNLGDEARSTLFLALSVPIIFFTLVTTWFLLLFSRKGSAVPKYFTPHKKIDLSVDEWRSVYASRLHCKYCWTLIVLSMLMFPTLIRQYSLLLPCMSTGLSEAVAVYAPYLKCDSHNYVLLKRLSLILLIITTTVPIVIGYLTTVYSAREDPTRFCRGNLILRFFSDGYLPRYRRLPLFPLNYLISNGLTALSIAMVGAPLEKALLFSVCFGGSLIFQVIKPSYETVLFKEPLASEATSNYGSNIIIDFFKRQLSPIKHSNILNIIQVLCLSTNCLSYVLLSLVFMVKNRAFSVACVVVYVILNTVCIFVTLRQLIREILLCGYSWKRILDKLRGILRKIKQKCSRDKRLSVDTGSDCYPKETEMQDTHSTSIFTVAMLVYNDRGEERDMNLLHSLGKIIRYSPFPAETISQVDCIIGSPKFDEFSTTTAYRFLFEKGHIEVQGEVISLVLPILQSVFSDVSRPLSTGKGFVKEIKDLLKILTTRFGILEKVKQCDYKAREISLRYQIIIQLLEPKSRNVEKDMWRALLDIDRNVDIRNRFMVAKNFCLLPEDISKLKTEFLYLFPSALPVSSANRDNYNVIYKSLQRNKLGKIL